MNNQFNLLYNYLNREINSRYNAVKHRLNNGELRYRSEYERIKFYLDNFINGDVLNRFIAIPGLRMTGKTTILYQLYDYLNSKEEIDSNQILYLSMDDICKLVDFDIKEIVEYFLSEFHNTNLLELDKPIFILIDETHYDKDWSLSGKLLYDNTDKLFMVFTGSSALDIELNVDAARRLLKIPLYPLNYNEYVSLKYNLNLDKTKAIKNMLFTGIVDDAIVCERKINNKLINSQKLKENEWKDYLLYGGFPIAFKTNDYEVISEYIYGAVNKIIETDLNSIENIQYSTNIHVNRIVRFLSLQKPGDISKNTLSNILDISSSSVQKILNLLEKSHLMFSVEPLSSSSKRIRKSWKYYFATSSLRHIIAENSGNSFTDINAYYGILAENLVASTFKTISRKYGFDIFYDSKKGGVDFLIRTNTFEVIPIEVGYGKKSKKQIKKAINGYGCDYGIIVSNTSPTIKKDEDVIHIPLKTFSFI